MGIAIGIIWVIIGLIVFLYNLCKESQMAIIAVAGVVYFIVSCIVVVNLPGDYILLGGIISVLIIIISYIIFMVWSYKDSKKDPKTKITEKFKLAGYNVKDEMIDILLKDPYSPLNRDKDKIVFSLSSCYDWMCFERENDLEYMSSDKFEELLGCSLEKLPLLKDVYLGWAYSVRKSLAIRHILEKEGLTFGKHSYNREKIEGIDNPHYIEEFESTIFELTKEAITRKQTEDI